MDGEPGVDVGDLKFFYFPFKTTTCAIISINGQIL
jgi:hypothetical protein